MKKSKNKKTLHIVINVLFIAIILVAYVLLFYGAVFWTNNQYYQVLNPFVEFPTDSGNQSYIPDIILRILSLSFVIISITYLIRFILKKLDQSLKEVKL